MIYKIPNWPQREWNTGAFDPIQFLADRGLAQDGSSCTGGSTKEACSRQYLDAVKEMQDAANKYCHEHPGECGDN